MVAFWFKKNLSILTRILDCCLLLSVASNRRLVSHILNLRHIHIAVSFVALPPLMLIYYLLLHPWQRQHNITIHCAAAWLHYEYDQYHNSLQTLSTRHLVSVALTLVSRKSSCRTKKHTTKVILTHWPWRSYWQCRLDGVVCPFLLLSWWVIKC
jgi:hypothetical protein